jgi:uncharacterized protein (TIGR02145 family)
MNSMKRIFLCSVFGISFLFSGCEKEQIKGTITDVDGNIYETIRIGEQWWTVENLKTTHFNDGSVIALIISDTEWFNLESPGYCWFDNDSVNYKETSGGLYNWYAVATGKLCPNDWHVPTQAEWDSLIAFLGGEDIAGGKLKESGTAHWQDPNVGATNESGFTALPACIRGYDGLFVGPCNHSATWWSSTSHTGSYAWYSALISGSSIANTNTTIKGYGRSVRCVRD